MGEFGGENSGDTYRIIDRETPENWYSGSNASDAPTETISYAYNPAGLLASATDENLTAGGEKVSGTVSRKIWGQGEKVSEGEREEKVSGTVSRQETLKNGS